MKRRPIMKGQTHVPELNFHGERVVGKCGEMEAEFTPAKSGDVIFLPEDCGNALIEADQLPNLIAALQTLNDHLRQR